jgi:hypothetical protein
MKRKAIVRFAVVVLFVARTCVKSQEKGLNC